MAADSAPAPRTSFSSSPSSSPHPTTGEETSNPKITPRADAEIVFSFGLAPRAEICARLAAADGKLDQSIAILAARVLGLVESRGLTAATTVVRPPLLIGVAGVPGSGKSTLSRGVAKLINAAGVSCAVLSMDGFHYTRAHLDTMADPEKAHARRGSPETFDVARFVAYVRAVRGGVSVMAPSFDHAVKDPVEDDVVVDVGTEVVLVEGNYVLGDGEGWGEVKGLLDESWFVECGLEEAMERVVRRQIKDGMGGGEEEVRARVASNDRVNAELVKETQGRADFVVPNGGGG